MTAHNLQRRGATRETEAANMHILIYSPWYDVQGNILPTT